MTAVGTREGFTIEGGSGTSAGWGEADLKLEMVGTMSESSSFPLDGLDEGMTDWDCLSFTGLTRGDAIGFTFERVMVGEATLDSLAWLA